jgi:hypothetical protein
VTADSRGQQVLDLTNALINALVAQGILPSARQDDTRVTMFPILADYLYGNAAIDIPPLRSAHAPDHRT